MKWKHEDKLLQKAGALIEVLKKAGVEAEVGLIRDYMLKLLLQKDRKVYGNAIIYYSPKKGSFSLKTHELKDKNILPVLERAWEEVEFEQIKNNKGYEIYVDGSHINGKVGYAFVVLKDGRKIKESFGIVTGEPYTLHHQVGGEIKAVEEALAWCEQNGIKEVTIYHDFLNLEKWATGEFETNNKLTTDYQKYVQNSNVKIYWEKVPGHSGVKWNEYVDKLARGMVSNR